MGWPGEHGVLLSPEIVLHNLGPMRSSPILLKDDPLEVLKVQVYGADKFLLQDGQVGGAVNSLWEAAGVADSLAGDATPDLEFVTPKLGHWLHHIGLQLLPRESPHESPLDGLVSVERGLIGEDDIVPEGGGFFGLLFRPLQTRMALRSSQSGLLSHPRWVQASSGKSSAHSHARNLAVEGTTEGRRRGGGLPPDSQDQLSLVSGAQDAMTAGGYLGDDVAFLLVLLQDVVHGSELHLKAVRNLL